jgi:hypothetical protein
MYKAKATLATCSYSSGYRSAGDIIEAKEQTYERRLFRALYLGRYETSSKRDKRERRYEQRHKDTYIYTDVREGKER